MSEINILTVNSTKEPAFTTNGDGLNTLSQTFVEPLIVIEMSPIVIVTSFVLLRLSKTTKRSTFAFELTVENEKVCAVTPSENKNLLYSLSFLSNGCCVAPLVDTVNGL